MSDEIINNNLIDENNFFNHFNGNHHHLPLSLEGHWQPFFDDRRDFNTNANSYYEYLANINYLIKSIVTLLNRVSKRNLLPVETKSIEIIKKYDWISENACNQYHDVVELSANVKRSNQSINYKTLINHVEKTYSLLNAIKEFDDGLFVSDYTDVINDISKHLENLTKALEKETQERINKDNDLNSKIDKEINDRQNADNDLINKINELKNENTKLKSALEKILTNLKNSGAWSSGDDVLTGNFVTNRNIATGNINLFSHETDGAYFIRTNNAQTENDLAGGV